MDQSLRWLAADETKHSCEVRMTEDGWSLKKSKGIKKKPSVKDYLLTLKYEWHKLQKLQKPLSVCSHLNFKDD